MENRALGGHIISFSAQNAPFSRKRSRTDLCGGALRRTSPGLHLLRPAPATPYSAPCRPVRLQLRPAWFLYRLVRLLRRPAWLPHDPAPSSRRARLPLSSPGAHITPRLFSRRSGNHSFRPAEPPPEVQNKKIRRFFGVFVKFLLLLQYIAVTTLYPRRNGLHAASASLLTREFR